MAIEFDCPACGRRAQAPDELAGRKARCPLCDSVIQVPQPATTAEAPLPILAGPAGDGETEARQPCPMCGELIVAGAAKCRFCGEIFDPDLRRAEQRRQGTGSDATLTAGEVVLAILCAGIGCILGIIYMIQGKPKGSKLVGLSLLVMVISVVLRLAILGGLDAGP